MILGLSQHYFPDTMARTTVNNIKLEINIADMSFNGTYCNKQLLRHLLRGKAFKDFTADHTPSH
jgi:hypothetical protein